MVCSKGADNSWVLYDLLNSTTNGNASKYVILYRSMDNTPGLTFLKEKPYDNIMENISFRFASAPFTLTSLYI
ncbi:DUF929 family protein [Ferroplasma acidiphilum]|uniref:DUF929 family protein n=1 Tax=Ferroplasma acidiphilum TaxID=74969 RepID=UPI002815D5FD|nr:DUF929 family protein [Ferroplasma acidiphilum]WMT53518.1 MAG: DUF929 family protein [Ferroplasma acidiphilum]